jgi:hypothetical protein
VDVTPPVIGQPGANHTISCPAEPVFTPPTATDLCDPDPGVFEVSDITTPGACPGVYVRTKCWVARDCSGNESNLVCQTIIVQDVTDPVIGASGDDATINCPAIPVFTPPGATDECDPDPTVNEISDDTTPGACPGAYVRTVCWQAEDCSGNLSAIECQTITVVDVTPPVLTDCPDPIVVCEGTPVCPEPPTASDECDPDVPVVCTRSDDPQAGMCDPYPFGTTTITCVALDDCGNRDDCSFTVTVNRNPECNIFEGDGFGAPICAGSTVAINDLFCGPDGMDSWTWSVDCGTIDGSTTSQCVSWIPPAEGSICTFTLIIVDNNGCTSNCTREVSVPVPTPCAPLPPPDPLPDCGSTGNSYCIGASLTITDVTVSCLDWQVTGWFNNCFTYDAGSSTGPCTFIIDANDVNGCPVSCEVSFECISEVFCTFTIGGWGSDCPASQAGDPLSTQPGCIRDHFFSSVFPSGVKIGNSGGRTATWTSAAAVNAFLPNGGTPGVLTQNYTNPLFTSAGVLASQILGLTLNVEYSCAGVFATLGLSDPGFCYGDFVITLDCGTRFAGITVDSFLVLANKVVSGQLITFRGSLLKPSKVNETATCLNQQFDGCDPFAALGEAIAAKYSWMPSAASEDEEYSEGSLLPDEFGLNQNYPNPFNPSTEISFSLPQATHVTIEIFNVMGQRMSTLIDQNKEAGTHTVNWDGSNVASGVYFYRLTTPEFMMTKKMLLMK